MSVGNKQLGITGDIEDLISEILTGPLTLEQREDLLDELGNIYEKARSLLKFGAIMNNYLGNK